MIDTNGDDANKVSGTDICNLVSMLKVIKKLSVGITLTLLATGLSGTKVALNEHSLVKIVTSLIWDAFSLDDGKLAELGTQLTVYFKDNGIFYEEIFAIMTKISIWPAAVNSPTITVPFNMCLSKVATNTEFFLKNSLYLQKEINYGKLVQWYDANKLDITK